LADSVRERGGVVREGSAVVNLADDGTHIRVTTTGGGSVPFRHSSHEMAEAVGDAEHEIERFDTVVLANGAWLSGLARSFGVVLPVQAGRGYSLSVPVDVEPSGPIYFPTARLACTPLAGRLRLAGTMEFQGPDAPLDPRRVAAMVAAARPLLCGVDLDAAEQLWVGPRPCTPDGLPLIGRTTSPRVFVAGGHSMWGITLGPLTGRLLATMIVSGETPSELAPFDPLRRRRPAVSP
jgi:D-amino-acid dehydrogenase